MVFPIDRSVSSSFFSFLAGVLARCGCERRWMECAAYRQGAPSQSLPFNTGLGSPSLEFLPSHVVRRLCFATTRVCFSCFVCFLFFFLSDPLPLNPVVSAFDSPHLFFFCVFHWRAAVSRVAISSSECSADVCLLPMRKKRKKMS